MALKRNNGKLVRFEELALRRAFGPPSSKKPPGHTMQWVAERFLKLKERAPDMKVAESPRLQESPQYVVPQAQKTPIEDNPRTRRLLADSRSGFKMEQMTGFITRLNIFFDTSGTEDGSCI